MLEIQYIFINIKNNYDIIIFSINKNIFQQNFSIILFFYSFVRIFAIFSSELISLFIPLISDLKYNLNNMP